MRYELHNTECMAWLEAQPSATYDAIIADPPYRTTNLAFDKGPGLDWAAWWAQAWRLVKPTGVVVLFAADLFTVDLILSQRANYRYRLVWCKTMGTGFLDANRRPLRAHEDVLIFNQKPSETTFNPQKTPGKPYGSWRKAVPAGHYGQQREESDGNPTGARYPLSYLNFGSEPTTGRLHSTQKPTDLMRWLVRTYTNPGDTILDCFAGSGSTLEACLLEGRQGVGVEIDKTYYQKAIKRLDAVVSTPTLFQQEVLAT